MKAADLVEFFVGEHRGVELVDAEAAFGVLDVVLDLVDEGGRADQRCLHVGVEAIAREREVSTLVEVDVHSAP